MPVPGNWVTALAQCKSLATALETALKQQVVAKAAHATKEKQQLARRIAVCAGVGYDLKKGQGGALLEAAEKAMSADATLRALDAELDALAITMAPPDKGPLKQELLKYEKLLAGPDLKGTDGKGKGIPADILKAHKDGKAFIAATRAKYGVK